MATSSLKTHSHASRTSSTGSAAAKARAKAEAAKTRLAYAEEEMNLKIQKAKLEASMEMLKHKKETAAAVAEAEVLEAAMDENIENCSCKLSLNSTPLETTQRTEQYVIDQSKVQETLQLCDDEVSPKTEQSKSYSISASPLKPEAKPFISCQNSVALQRPHISAKQPCMYENEYARESCEVRFESDHATPMQSFRTQNNSGHPTPLQYTISPNSNQSSSHINDFVRYLARRELVATGLLQFNDKPQNYRAWKRSFQTATTDLNLTPSEEMDLLLKWLGRESAGHVEQIRAIHINNPQAGLAMTWDRLEQTYGSAEVIEDALFKRIDTFPKIANRDYCKLTKLSDLLMELQSAKAEGDLPGLVFLDTARGVNPIVQKLPFRLQEKWASVGAAYKQQHHVPYPPFAYFVDFVSHEARIGNDPSFNFIFHVDIAPKIEKPAWRPSREREISVHKTAVSSRVYMDTGEPLQKSDDCDKLCPIHRKPHPLRKCRAFRERPIEARKAILKENNVCFKCCSSASHIAKNCKFKVQCSECKSERHHTALHPGPAPWIEEVEAVPEYGGEEDGSPQSQVTNKCTEVCGEDQTDRSCSKICLVRVFPAGRRDMAVKVYAILDEQSNRSLVRSHFFKMFSDQSPSAPYILRTCAGVKESAGRRASGYEVESLDGTVCIPLPSLIECNDIPNNREEIPTPDVARRHPHLNSVAEFIPEEDPQAPIMLLLGRDIIRVHKVRKQVNGSHNLPYAQKLDLGWVIVGNVCLGNVHKPQTIRNFHTNITEPKRPTLFHPCPNVFHGKEKYEDTQLSNYSSTYSMDEYICEADHLGCTVFKRSKDDNKVAPSLQDASFMKIMEEGLHKDSNSSWVAPLPFKSPRSRLSNNRFSSSDQWRYVPTDQNPADHATRSKFLLMPESGASESIYNLVDPSLDPEVRPLVSTLSTTTSSKKLGSQRFAKFSSWKSLTGAITRLLHVARLFNKAAKENSSCKGWHYCKAEFTVEESNKASAIIIRTVQEEVYSQEIKCIQKQERIPKSSPLHTLDPFIDAQGLLRVGGRLHHSSLNQNEKCPLVIPGKHHIATLLIRHHHEHIQHQGRHLTEGAVRSAGLWIVGGKRMVSSIIHKCVTCRRLRAPLSSQKMASLPADHLSTEPPFTSVGLDVFGPWSVTSRRTRGGFSQSKRWAVIFTCLSVRAVHIEVIESLDTSSFINALRRFLAVRGPVKHIRSDRGTNFVGACKDLKIPSNIDSKTVKTYLLDRGCTWTFNPPHASHCGGPWERMIGIARRILDSMFLQLKDKLTHEVLVTFMAEVAAIINARPLVPVTTDPEESFILTPAALLTQKVNFVSAPAGEFGVADLYKCQWRKVQHLSNTFWDRWRKQFLPTLQERKKWQSVHPNIISGSVVLLKKNQVSRNEWPLGLVTQTFSSQDGKVRQVEVKVIKPGGSTCFLRPITEIVLLISPEYKVDGKL